MNKNDLELLLEQLVSSQAKRDQQLAELDAAERALVTAFEKEYGIDPVFQKVAQTLAVMRAADRMSGEAVAELARLVDERRGDS